MRKMLKKLGIVIPSAVLTLLMAVGFSTPAFAYVEPEVKEEPVQVIEEEEPTEEEKFPFTIAGNGEVEDNITDDSSKEFFTVKTKGGNTFFLVIDRARNNENVYMLSMIDEYDLQEFLTDEERNGKEEEKPAVVLPETKPEPEPEVEIEEVAENEWRIGGSMRLDEIARKLDILLPEEEYDTIGGLVFGELNAIPTVGAVVELPEAGVTIRVVSVDERRVEQVLLTRQPRTAEEEAEAE